MKIRVRELGGVVQTPVAIARIWWMVGPREQFFEEAGKGAVRLLFFNAAL